jgi:glutathione synthase/RimK-type ligase-like ATP-grasp enzyme
MRIWFMLGRRKDPSEIVEATTAILQSRGIQVEHEVAEDALTRPDVWSGGRDLHVVKAYTDLSLSLAAVLHGRGARLVNPFPAIAASRDKIVAAQVLADAGIPAPRTWVTGDLGKLRPLVRECPLIVKPYHGWRGEGVRVVRTEADLASLPEPAQPWVVQEYLEGCGEDLRVYVAGERVYATKKPFSSTSFSVPGRPVPVPSEVGEIALRVGRAFGLGLFGIDVLESWRGPRVVDVNHFPGYKGCPGAAETVADYLEGAAAGRIDVSAGPVGWGSPAASDSIRRAAAEAVP